LEVPAVVDADEDYAI